MGIVTFVYFNPELDRYWVLDYRVFDPARDGKSKLDHVNEMLSLAEQRGLLYRTALMDSWYATTQLMTRLHHADKLFYCPLKNNRLGDDTKGQEPYQAVETLSWTATQVQQGKLVKVKGFAKTLYLKLFRVAFLGRKSASTLLQNDKRDFRPRTLPTGRTLS